MNPRVKSVKANPNYTLTLIFTNEEQRVFDVKPYLERGVFRELQNWAMFQTVKPFLGSIQWQNELDFCPDTLYLESVRFDTSPNLSLETNLEQVVFAYSQG